MQSKLKRYFAAFIIAVLVTIAPWCSISAREFVVVIDPGHGGKDHGALGALSHEKDVNLGVALKLGDLIKKNMKDVKVVYTRSTDNFISLQRRADIANEVKGDLFISIHSNSAPEKSKNRTMVNGTSVYVLGSKSEANLSVAQRENSVIMLEDNYKTTYAGFDPSSPESYIAFELIQNQHLEHSLKAANAIQKELVMSAGRKDNGVRQAMFWVLVRTGMPAVLIELDFISNPTADRYLGSEAGQTQLAEAILNGFRVYKSTYDRELEQINALPNDRDQKKTTPEPKPTENTNNAKESKPKQTEASTTGKIVYKVQFLASPRQFKNGAKELKGIKDPEVYRDGGLYKYTTGASTDLKDIQKTLKEIKKLFPDAFVIKTMDGKRIK